MKQTNYSSLEAPVAPELCEDCARRRDAHRKAMRAWHKEAFGQLGKEGAKIVAYDAQGARLFRREDGLYAVISPRTPRTDLATAENYGGLSDGLSTQELEGRFPKLFAEANRLYGLGGR